MLKWCKVLGHTGVENSSKYTEKKLCSSNFLQILELFSKKFNLLKLTGTAMILLPRTNARWIGSNDTPLTQNEPQMLLFRKTEFGLDLVIYWCCWDESWDWFWVSAALKAYLVWFYDVLECVNKILKHIAQRKPFKLRQILLPKFDPCNRIWYPTNLDFQNILALNCFHMCFAPPPIPIYAATDADIIHKIKLHPCHWHLSQTHDKQKLYYSAQSTKNF